MFQTNKYIKHNKKRQPGMAKAKKNDQFGIMLSNKYILFDTFGTKNPKNVPKQEKPLLCFSSPQNLSYSLLQLKKSSQQIKNKAKQEKTPNYQTHKNDHTYTPPTSYLVPHVGRRSTTILPSSGPTLPYLLMTNSV